MANGHSYDMWNAHTSASNVYPLGTWLRVTYKHKSVVVKVTDREAFRYPIVVDLSYAAFRRLANPNVGVIPVKVSPIHL